jgi:hypothetical protein
MPLTLPEVPAFETWGRVAQAEYWAYRVGGYLLMNVMDDPAWLALVFC